MMSKKILTFFTVLMLVPILCWADVINIKHDAPQKYIVQKGDTLWDISKMYLDKPWLWPELWRTNTHITNPHLIYPGDELSLSKNEQGETVIELVRQPSKAEIKMSPQGNKTVKMPDPIPALPWSTIRPFIENDQIMQQVEYDRHPYILGNQDGSVLFASNNITLSKASRSRQKNYNVLHKQNEIYDMSGNFIGLQVRHVANAEVIDSDIKGQRLVKIEDANHEVQRGDRLAPQQENEPTTIILSAAEEQRGFIIDDLEQHRLLGKYNVVIIDLGSDLVSAGTVMGIYTQGPNIIDDVSPKYKGENDPLANAFILDSDIVQPALKVGELVVFKVFDKASYALITRSSTVIRRGAIVAKP
ncbi:MAG: LysM peptidoglycan-binding domain-containing protein [Paraglaciecola sp.]|uniref:LysM peptidoglycan-binding domain-containing protein n=1 Tax=Paraglaciecola sp. TaxID=1920173 RepID=UPI00273FE829|nr:LysM domain-containing protein [Paraglaciecola sp.]MDP5032680.1 LysM peptidoglycan-binding domain-containing protein [Paraglaciecola sp.]MDP5134136.1 LysM peptidoglycan-binding domain-containing protein [Paraglaciecola sp.]